MVMNFEKVVENKRVSDLKVQNTRKTLELLKTTRRLELLLHAEEVRRRDKRLRGAKVAMKIPKR